MTNIHKLDIQGHKTDQLISQWIDGELSSDEHSEFASRLAMEPALAARVEQFKYTDGLLCELLSADKITLNPAIALRLTTPEPSLPKAHSNKHGRQIVAIAATVMLACGLTFQWATSQQSGAYPIGVDVAQALEVLPSRAEGWDTLADGSSIRTVLTFPSAQGAWCREFMLAQEADHWRGVACRHDGSWVTQVMARGLFIEQDSGYRQASAQDVDSVTRFIDQQAADVALSAKQEQTIIASGWMSAASSD